MLTLTLLTLFWTLCILISYRYLRHLFRDLKFGWTSENRYACIALSIAGPAALICSLAVDFARPLA